MSPRTVFVTCLGLMGASLAAALTKAGYRVFVHHRRPEVAVEVERKGWGTAVVEPAEALSLADLAVVCTPVTVTGSLIRTLATLPGRAIFTDLGSVKGALCCGLADLEKSGRFVGSHPMCGSHRTGLAAADPELYRGALTVLTPTTAPGPAVAAVEALWTALGARTVRISAQAHDQVMVAASHLPHVLGALAAAGLDAESAPFAASGFRDTTRVAAGSPELWCGILLENREALRLGLAEARGRLDTLDQALLAGDVAAVTSWLEAGRQGRQRFTESRCDPS